MDYANLLATIQQPMIAALTSLVLVVFITLRSGARRPLYNRRPITENPLRDRLIVRDYQR